MLADHLSNMDNAINNGPKSFDDIMKDIDEVISDVGLAENNIPNHIKLEENSTLKKCNDLVNRVSNIYNYYSNCNFQLLMNFIF